MNTTPATPPATFTVSDMTGRPVAVEVGIDAVMDALRKTHTQQTELVRSLDVRDQAVLDAYRVFRVA